MVTTSNRLDRRTTTLLIAAVLALGTGLLTFNYLTSLGRHQSAVVAPRAVLVATRDIAARAQIGPDMVMTVMRPGDAIDPDALNAPQPAVGRTAAVSIPAGSTVTASKVATTEAQTLVTRVPRGMRAIAIPMDRVRGVGQLIQPGDHVDVIAATAARGSQAPAAATVLRDVQVLAVGTTLESPNNGATPAPESSYQTATLAVTPTQAKLLTLVDLNATIRLTLRAPGDAAHRPLTGESIDLSAPAPPRAVSVAAPAPAARAAAPAPAAPQPVAAAPVPRRAGVQIISGDKVVQQ